MVILKYSFLGSLLWNVENGKLSVYSRLSVWITNSQLYVYPIDALVILQNIFIFCHWYYWKRFEEGIN